VFDLDGPIGQERAVDRRSACANILDRLTVVQIRGGRDFAALGALIGDLLGR